MAGTLSCCLNPEVADQKQRSQAIDNELSMHKSVIESERKVLVLGAEGSGKSTFMKQMKIIHGQEFSDEDIREFRIIIYNNIIKGLKVLSDARDKLGIEWVDPENQQHAVRIMGCDNGVTMDPGAFVNYVSSAKSLWKDQGIQNAYDRRSEFQLADSVKYFLDDVDRVGQRDYVPTSQDILHSQKATNGILDYSIDTNYPEPFRFVEVGGQIWQRQKWFTYFEEFTSLLFFVPSSEFDQVLMEDCQTNRLLESCNIFDTIVNNKYLVDVTIFLCLNKTDLLERKIKHISIKKWFPNFSGESTDLNTVQAFILNMFDMRRRRNRDMAMYHYSTTAVDTQNIKDVDSSIRDRTDREFFRQSCQ